MQVFHVKIFLLKGADSCLHFRGQIKTFNHTVYWEKSQKEGFWSDEGCVTNLKSSNETHVICECYHLANFALLMSVTDAADNVNVRVLFA